MTQQEFNEQVERFLQESGMAPSTFGKEAVNDRGFIKRIRSGGRCWPETQGKCLAFMADQLAS